MVKIDVDFDVFKKLTVLRESEETTESDVIRKLLGMNDSPSNEDEETWRCGRAAFRVGTRLRHLFRDGRSSTGKITKDGINVDDIIFSDFSPAATHVAGHQSNGWQFWEVQLPDGSWVKADYFRQLAG